MVRKGKLAVFEGCGISETVFETTPTKIGVHLKPERRRPPKLVCMHVNINLLLA